MEWNAEWKHTEWKWHARWIGHGRTHGGAPPLFSRIGCGDSSLSLSLNRPPSGPRTGDDDAATTTTTTLSSTHLRIHTTPGATTSLTTSGYRIGPTRTRGYLELGPLTRRYRYGRRPE